ncbi:sensor histidine kinase [Amycolatopsis sp. H20-H5]|uniref:sensor histidine kinase n=1 Tax=Amycolatopsis sp. H20-H5 TaxID=3046309 RepID=UPI002DC00CCE|nr:histidine kinase [Amycolatopsis sp. H20-H5]MEC3973970.1 histidine kinase [Amycolatopsis sp. H20-H5]
MTTQAGERQAKPAALDWARWGFVVIPMLTSVVHATPLSWVLAAVTVLAATPFLRVFPAPAWLMPVATIAVVALSGALGVVQPSSWASVAMFATTFYAVRTLSKPVTIGALVTAATVIVVWTTYREVNWIDALPLAGLLVVIMLLGINRNTRAAKLEQTELALARAQTAAEEHARAAALAERTRIARELHDVLAHSLAGLALNLQGARLMLVRDGANPDVVAQIVRAQKLATEGLAEARKAVAALREDAVPVERAVSDLLAGYRLDTGARADLNVDGEARELDAAVGTMLVRAVQEALSNTRKHAPNAAVAVTLTYTPSRVELTVADRQGRRPTAALSAGYGLRGMGERVALLDGRLDSGPVEDGWRVHLTVPCA